MGDWYYVTYQFGSGGRLTGFGSIEMEMASPPRPGGGDVQRLSQEITEASHERGTLPLDTGVVVTVEDG
jgi:hypothetical protein